MKNTLIKFILVGGLAVTINSCAAPEDRAVEEVNDTTATMSASGDSSGTPAGSMDSLQGNSDSPVANTKMETFKHTPIDTITSKEDTGKH